MCFGKRLRQRRGAEDWTGLATETEPVGAGDGDLVWGVGAGWGTQDLLGEWSTMHPGKYPDIGTRCASALPWRRASSEAT